MNHSFKPPVEQRIGEKSTQFVVNAKPLDIMPILYDMIKAKDKNITVSEKSWKFRFEGKMIQDA